jgi:hypothetical protein
MVMGKQSKTLITDGLPSYTLACDQVFLEEQTIFARLLSREKPTIITLDRTKRYLENPLAMLAE